MAVVAAQELEKNKKVKGVKRSGMYVQIVQRPLAVTRAVMKFKYNLFCFPSKGPYMKTEVLPEGISAA
jgi:hypothetical protein